MPAEIKKPVKLPTVAKVHNTTANITTTPTTEECCSLISSDDRVLLIQSVSKPAVKVQMPSTFDRSILKQLEQCLGLLTLARNMPVSVRRFAFERHFCHCFLQRY